jgi:hypothetical protein
MTQPKSKKQEERKFKMMLSKKPEESWEQFEARVVEELEKAKLLAPSPK